MTGSLEGTVVWATDAGKGLGRAIATTLVGEGATVMATSRGVGQLRSLQSEHGPACVVVAAGSVTDETDVERIASGLPARDSGRLHGLVTCAGISPPSVRSEDLDVQTFQRILATNSVGMFRYARAAACIVLSQPGRGSIASVSSMHARGVHPRIAAYAASKGVVAALTTALAVEWADRGVRVNAIAPGYFPTDLSRGPLDSTWGQHVRRRIPVGRTGQPDELGRAALYPLSDDSSYVTGATISVDGGWQAW